jgi:hypothetical protein
MSAYEEIASWLALSFEINIAYQKRMRRRLDAADWLGVMTVGLFHLVDEIRKPRLHAHAQAGKEEQTKLRRKQQDALLAALHDWVFDQVEPFSIAMANERGLRLPPDKLTPAFSTRIGIALRKLGCTKVEKRTGKVRFWWIPPNGGGARLMQTR